jgi:hypothetical protein
MFIYSLFLFSDFLEKDDLIITLKEAKTKSEEISQKIRE